MPDRVRLLLSAARTFSKGRTPLAAAGLLACLLAPATAQNPRPAAERLTALARVDRPWIQGFEPVEVSEFGSGYRIGNAVFPAEFELTRDLARDLAVNYRELATLVGDPADAAELLNMARVLENLMEHFSRVDRDRNGQLRVGELLLLSGLSHDRVRLEPDDFLAFYHTPCRTARNAADLGAESEAAAPAAAAATDEAGAAATVKREQSLPDFVQVHLVRAATPALDQSGAAEQSLTISLAVGDLTCAGVTAYETVIAYDPNVLSFAGFEAGTLSRDAAIYSPPAGAGRLHLIAVAGQDLLGKGELLRLNFNVVGAPVSPAAPFVHLRWEQIRFGAGSRIGPPSTPLPEATPAAPTAGRGLRQTAWPQIVRWR